jgi:hypothetical protein
MATQVKIKRRTADATAPTGLTAGEMAINLVDKKLYVGGTAGTNVIFLDSTSSVGLGTANTFTQLNTFSAGISASGATFTGLISGATATFSKDITVNSMTVGLGKSSDTNNVAIGNGALASNTSDQPNSSLGSYNTAVGGSALTSNTTGQFNTAIGAGTLSTNSSGENNIAIGYGALTNSSTAGNNLAIGINSLDSLTVGDFNIGIGSDALGAVGNTGSQNVGVGYQSLTLNTSGSNNTGVGSNVLRQITTGSQLTALGNNAGRYRGTGTTGLASGTNGIYIGHQARASANALTNEIVIGADALGLGSNTAVIGATLQSAATIYGLLNLPSGLSSTGATFTGPIISTGYQISSGAINAQTASYSLVAGDNGKIVTMNVGTGNTLTVPASLAVGFNCTVIQLGAGQTTIAASGTTLNSYQGYLKISGQHGSASIIGYTSNVYNVAGSLSA